METVEDVVIIGAGIAGLATALGLHRMGVRSLVLESSDSLRAAGFGLATWNNAWRALDALGVGDSLRQSHVRLQGATVASATSGATTSQLTFTTQGKSGEHEVRCLRRNILLETLEKELPLGTVRYSSKVAAIEEDGYFKLLHLADGSTLKTKVLIGCDGVNSVVAKWLGLKKPAFTERSASRGFTEFPNGHGLKLEFVQYFGEGFRTGLLPCDEKTIYWFFTWIPSEQEKEVEQSATKMKQYILSKLKHSSVPEEFIHIIEISDLSNPVSAQLRYRWPFSLLWGDISKENVCVAGDAFHPMTPDLGQGGCSALEDSIVLARCLSEALLGEHNGGAEVEYDKIEKGLEKYSKERRWRSFKLIATAYVVGRIQQSNGAIIGFLRDKFLSRIMARLLLKIADFDFGKL
ncbi:monooxygenase 2 [Elaeis guineensis]|uniref:Monooxygenase 2 n=1 Tax=Elaeis guineensis var. tenera TaxID=51953 RepID=A0A8N4F6C5_ELAGV|nr:monooxygenase 2 [Elaeis guineensis]XP_029120052.1 monooxygenase 2 [Elaeis guineensis]